ncbi:hypothetical protein ACFLRM_07000 [Acidobacteriota bacterium]
MAQTKSLDQQKLEKAILDACYEINGKKKLGCTKAFELAKIFHLEPIKIGKSCNQLKIKITNCQLGCFK